MPAHLLAGISCLGWMNTLVSRVAEIEKSAVRTSNTKERKEWWRRPLLSEWHQRSLGLKDERFLRSLNALEEWMLRRRRETELLLRFCPAQTSITTHLSDPEDQLAYARQAAFCCPPLPWAGYVRDLQLLWLNRNYCTHSGELARSGFCNCNDLMKRVPKPRLQPFSI